MLLVCLALQALAVKVGDKVWLRDVPIAQERGMVASVGAVHAEADEHGWIAVHVSHSAIVCVSFELKSTVHRSVLICTTSSKTIYH